MAEARERRSVAAIGAVIVVSLVVVIALLAVGAVIFAAGQSGGSLVFPFILLARALTSWGGWNAAPTRPRPRPFVRITRSEVSLIEGARQSARALRQVTEVHASRSGRVVVRGDGPALGFTLAAPAEAAALARRIELRAKIARRSAPYPVAIALEALALTGAEAVLLRRNRFVRAVSMEEARAFRRCGKQRVFARALEDRAAQAGPYRTAAAGDRELIEPVD